MSMCDVGCAMSDVKPLSSLRVRLVTFSVMAGIAVAAIWLIDRRAMMTFSRADEPADVTP